MELMETKVVPSYATSWGIEMTKKRSEALDNDANRPGSVEKACRILKAMTDPSNQRLTDIAAHCGMGKSTVMRILDTLISEGLVLRDPETKRYCLGPEMARIGASAREKVDWRDVGRASLMRLADEFQDMVILAVLNGVETVCVDFQKGSYPIQANFQELGSRRTLGVGSGGVAVLAAMSESERETALRLVRPRLARYPLITDSLLRDRVDAAIRNGHAVLLDVVVEHMGGIAVAVLAPNGRPLAALSIAALSDRIQSREAELAASLKKEAAAIGARLAEQDWGPTASVGL